MIIASDQRVVCNTEKEPGESFYRHFDKWEFVDRATDCTYDLSHEVPVRVDNYWLSIRFSFQRLNSQNQVANYRRNTTSERRKGQQHPHREDVAESESVHGDPL